MAQYNSTRADALPLTTCAMSSPQSGNRMMGCSLLGSTTVTEPSPNVTLIFSMDLLVGMMRLMKRSHQGRAVLEGRDGAFVAGIVFWFPSASIGAILRSTNGAPAGARLVAFRPS